MVRCFREDYGNAGSPHEFGLRSKSLVNQARERIAQVVNARRHEVIFTSGATESNNLAILGLAEHGTKVGKKHIVSSQVEHKAVLEPLEVLSRRGFEVTLIPPLRSGAVSSAAILDAIRDDTLLVSLMHGNNETGVLQPIQEVADGLSSRFRGNSNSRSDVYFHVDASQTFGKTDSGLSHERIDLVSISGHKINGPSGIGALVARKRGTSSIPISPVIFGGGQELGLRSGTLPVALICGLGLAAQLAAKEQRERRLACQQIRQDVLSKLATLNPTYHGDPSLTMPHVISVSFPDWDAEELIEELEGIAAVSTGAACTSICATASHVLSAMHVDPRLLDGAIRISWGHETDRRKMAQAIDRMIERLASKTRPQELARRVP